jgi:hypothetical protein
MFEELIRCGRFIPLALVLLATPALADDAEDRVPISAVAAPSAAQVHEFDLDPHYTKLVDVGGLPVVSSGEVADAALLEAAWLIRQMIGHRPDVLRAMADNKVRFSIMSVNELTTAIPEHSDLRPRDYWDRRARGLGATPERPSVSCGEENLLCYPGDPYSTENILIHEFGHAIHQMGLNVTDPTFDDRLEIVFDQAMAAGLWKEKYASTNRFEYWAEGVQSWFDTNREDDHDHNHVNTRGELREYDPDLAKLVEEVFGDEEWRYTRPSERRELPHLETWNPDESPRFEWPADVVSRYEAFQRASRAERPDPSSNDWADAETLPLDVLAGLKSPESDAPSTLLFVNRRESPIHIDWITTDGARDRMLTVRPNNHDFMSTFDGHLFLVSEGDTPLAIVAGGEGNVRFLAEEP